MEVRKYILENFKVDYSSAYVMTGFRADDSYFTFASGRLIGCSSKGRNWRFGRNGFHGSKNATRWHEAPLSIRGVIRLDAMS